MKERRENLWFFLLVAMMVAAFPGCMDPTVDRPTSEDTQESSGQEPTALTAPLEEIQSARPLSDFLDAQGSTNIFVPPVPDFIGWSNNPPELCASIDYAGLEAKWLLDNFGIDLGTQISGTVTEHALSDGRAEVTVNVSVRNSLFWVVSCLSTGNPFTLNPPLFGYRAQEIAADPVNKKPTLGNCEFQVVFKNTAPGAPLPDLLYLDGSQGQELVALSVHGRGTGALRATFGVPEGTRGGCNVVQNGTLFRTSFGGATGDGFPVEIVDLQVLGRSGRGHAGP